MGKKVLVINPGSTSTKIAVYDEDGEIFEKTIQHSSEEFARFDKVLDQVDVRKELILQTMQEQGVAMKDVAVTVGRGGLVRPVEGGVYAINQKMLKDLANDRIWGRTHASNLGAYLAKSLADSVGVGSYIADPVTVDEMSEISKISGVPEISRKSMFHALNIRACIRKVSREMKKPMEECNFVAIHMGGGISVVAVEKGRCVDVNNGLLGMGPFSPQRAGALPNGDLLEMAYSGEYTLKGLEAKLTKRSGLTAYLGTDNGQEICKRIDAGDERAKFIFEAMAYQIAKEAGGCAAVLKGKVDAVIYTGGLAHVQTVLMPFLKEHLQFLGKQIEFPGEKEMEALAHAALRVLKGEEEAKEYNA